MDKNHCSSTNFHWHHWPLGIEGSRQHYDFCEMVGKTSTKKPWESGLSFHVYTVFTLGALVTVFLPFLWNLSLLLFTAFVFVFNISQDAVFLAFISHITADTFPFSPSPGLVFFPRHSDGTDAGKFSTTPEVNDQTLAVFFFRKEMPRAGRRCQSGSSEKHRLFLLWAGWAQTPSWAPWCQCGPATAARDSPLPHSSCRWSITHPHDLLLHCAQHSSHTSVRKGIPHGKSHGCVILACVSWKGEAAEGRAVERTELWCRRWKVICASFLLILQSENKPHVTQWRRINLRLIKGNMCLGRTLLQMCLLAYFMTANYF